MDIEPKLDQKHYVMYAEKIFASYRSLAPEARALFHDLYMEELSRHDCN